MTAPSHPSYSERTQREPKKPLSLLFSQTSGQELDQREHPVHRGPLRGSRLLRIPYVIEESPMNTKTRAPKHQQSKAEPKHYTPQQVEQSILKALAPALEAKGGSAQTFADWTLNGHGVVLRLPNGQEYWCTVAEAGY